MSYKAGSHSGSDTYDEGRKTLIDPKSLHKRRKSPSLPGTRNADDLFIPIKAKNVGSTEGVANTTIVSDTLSQNDDSEATEVGSMTLVSNGAGSSGGRASDPGAKDELDASNGVVDPLRTKQEIERLQKKINKTIELIQQEQTSKEDHVNEYLTLSSKADRQQQQRIKTVFEKQNQKSKQTLAQYQIKLEKYQKRLRHLETHGATGHRQPKDLFKDVGQGLKGLFAKETRSRDPSPSRGVVDNVRGAKEMFVSKPKSLAMHLMKTKKYGSAEDINNIRSYDECVVADDTDKNSHHSGNVLSRTQWYSDEDGGSIVSSESGPSGPQSSSRPMSDSQATGPPQTNTPPVDFEQVYKDIQDNLGLEFELKLHNAIETYKVQLSHENETLKQILDEERFKSERLEEQINDLTELHLHEVTNIKQELSSMEEKMEYQLEERTSDMQELLETCQTRITKMELQQQQQQLISMEGIENTTFRAILTKLINVVLAILSVILILVSTVTNVIGPFLTTRVRVICTLFLILAIVLAHQNWISIQQLFTSAIDRFRR